MHVNYIYLIISDASFQGQKLIYKNKSTFIMNKALNNFNPDVVYSNLESSYSLVYCLFHNKYCVITIHSIPDIIFTRQFVTLQKILNLKKETTLVGVAECVSKRAKSVLGKSFTKAVTTIYIPIQTENYFRENVNHHDIIFINVARMNPIKNQKLLKQAFFLARKEFDNINLRIVGDGKLWEDLHDEAKELGILSDVDFFGNRNDVSENYQFPTFSS